MNGYLAKPGNDDLERRGQRRANESALRRGRLLARLRAGKLDRALAAGASPDSSPALALRAEALSSPRMRSTLGQAVERLIERSGPHPLGPRVSPSRAHLDAAQEELGELARRLRADRLTDAGGVARVRELLSDGGGPLFWDRSHEDLRTTVRTAIAALEPTPDQSRAREIP